MGTNLGAQIATGNAWNISDGLEMPPPSSANDEVKKVYERQCKMVLAIITMSSVGKKLAYIQGCQRPSESLNFFIQHT